MILLTFLFLAELSRGAAPAAEKPAPRSSLRLRIDAHIQQERFAAGFWGVHIVSLRSGETLYAHHANKLLKPASNAKLFTAALALDRLGPEFRFRTSVLAARKPSRTGTIGGDLVVFGRGDPSMAARFNEGDHAVSLRPLVDAVKAAGIKRVRGDLIADESYFRGPPYGFGWAWDDLQYYYGARVSALTVDDNVVDLIIRPGATAREPCSIEAHPPPLTLNLSNRTVTITNGGVARVEVYRPVGAHEVYITGQIPCAHTGVTEAVSVPDPARWFGQLFRQALAAEGIVVRGQVKTRDWLNHEEQLPALQELAGSESVPLREILPKMLKPSQNLYAQLLLLQVGAQTNAAPEMTTEQNGLLELRRFLGQAGIDAQSVLLEEGSGLSRGALVTPAAVTQLLRYMNGHPAAEVFRAALPVAGLDGTLRQRFRATAAAGKVRAKTGTIRYVNTLSGYATTAEGEPVAFSIFLNNYAAPPAGPSARGDIDAIVLMLVEP